MKTIKGLGLSLVSLCIVFSGSALAAGDFDFSFTRNQAFRNSYYLNINNKSGQVVMFGAYSKGYYYAEMNDGSVVDLDAKAFYEKHFRGAMQIG